MSYYIWPYILASTQLDHKHFFPWFLCAYIFPTLHLEIFDIMTEGQQFEFLGFTLNPG